MALLSYLQGRDVTFMPEIVERVHPSNNPGIFFIAVLVLLIIFFTTTKLRGIYSVVTVITVAFFVVLFAWPRTQPRPHPSASRKFFAVSKIRASRNVVRFRGKIRTRPVAVLPPFLRTFQPEFVNKLHGVFIRRPVGAPNPSPRTQPRPHPSASRKFFAVSAIGICWYVGRS